MNKLQNTVRIHPPRTGVPFAELSQLIGASGLLVAGRITGAATTLLFAVALTRTMEPAEVGAVLTAIATAFLASIFATLYIESGSIRFLVVAKEQGRLDVLNGFISTGRLILACAAPIVAGAFVVSNVMNGETSERLPMVLAAAAIIPVIGWLRLSGSHGTALGQALRSSLPRTTLQPVVQLAFFVIYASVTPTETPGGAMLCVLASYLATAIVQFSLLRKTFAFARPAMQNAAAWRDWVGNGLLLAPMPLMQEYLQHAILLAASLVLPPEQIAVLGVSLRLIAFIRFGILSVNMAVSHKVSRSIVRGDNIERDRHLRAAALIKIIPAVVASTLIVALGNRLLSVFGPQYLHGSTALAWLTLIPIGAALFGPNQMLLNIAGERLTIFLISVACIVLLFIAVPLGGFQAGLSGVAAGAAAATLVWESSTYIAVRRRVGADASLAGMLFVRRERP